MTERILEIAETPVRLRVELSQLVIDPLEGDRVTTPLSELAVLVLSQPGVTMTQAVISRLAEAGGTLLVCDSSHMPSAMMLPLASHVLQTERFRRQIEAPLPLRKRLWQQIIQAKVRAQGRLLLELHGDDDGLISMADRVLSGDSSQIEAQAARRYWPKLFQDPHFRRGREGPDQNSHLNYGYAVLRAAVARAICATGLHPSFGLRHHNRYDTFCLASDLVEPFRPLVDRAVWEWVQDHDPAEPLDREARAWLLRPILRRYVFDGEERSLFDLISRTASSLARAFLGEERKLKIPEV